ncbi:GerMN domain-containing protein [Candidatus Poribacteria bacterium]|nr:GerMN domain-containing protein [Candidatus Poribacteria bacterium]
MDIIRKIIHSRLFILWVITLVVIVILLAITLLLISNSKKTVVVDAPPVLPHTANTTKELPPSIQVKLFLYDPTLSELIAVYVDLRLYPDPTERLKQIITALVNETRPNYRNPIPGGTKLNEVYIDNQMTAYLDFSHHLADGQIGGTTAEVITVTSILNTVFEAFPDKIRHVQILIDGEEVEKLGGHLDISNPLRF